MWMLRLELLLVLVGLIESASEVLPNVNIFDDHVVKYVNMGYFKNGVGASLLAIFSSAAQTGTNQQ